MRLHWVPVWTKHQLYRGMPRCEVKGDHEFNSLSPRLPFWAHATRSRKTFLKTLSVIVGTVLVICTFSTFSNSAIDSTRNRHESYLPNPTHLPKAQPGHLRLLIPASDSNPNLCKTVLSTLVLGYSTPVLVNWGKTYNEPGDIFGGSHIAKITGTLDYLNTLPSRYDDDLVVFMDGYDIWYQLRPSVFLSRYHDIIRRGNDRLRASFGGEAAKREGIENKILFSAQKRCWPKDADHPACFAVPDSTLPKFVYGPQTDMDIGDELNPFLKFRQRYLNSGLVAGPVAAMRQLFRRAHEAALIDKGWGSDQAIFAQLMGEQEFQREVVRQRNRSAWRALVEKINLKLGWTYDILDPSIAGTHQLMEHFDGTPYEFGIALDYENELSLPTRWSEWDAEWLPYSDGSRRLEVSQSFNVTSHDFPFPEDVAASQLPFQAFSQAPTSSGGDALPLQTPWQDVHLFTNLWTGIIPVAAHHNAMLYDLKDRLQTHWDRPWFQKHARALLNAHAEQSMQPVASVALNNHLKEYWGTSVEKAGVLTDDDRFIPWEDLCAGTEGELFGDGLGPWKNPRDFHAEPE